MSTGRETRRSSTFSKRKARPSPAKMPEAAMPRIVFIVFESMDRIGAQGCWTVLMFGILFASSDSSARAFSRLPWR
jgi:hypothetical protein